MFPSTGPRLNFALLLLISLVAVARVNPFVAAAYAIVIVHLLAILFLRRPRPPR
jgi:hypothetical protein